MVDRLEPERVVFPYADMESAVKDKFKKLDGPVAAIRLLRLGYQTMMWRANWSARSKARAALEDVAFAAVQTPPKKRRE